MTLHDEANKVRARFRDLAGAFGAKVSEGNQNVSLIKGTLHTKKVGELWESRFDGVSLRAVLRPGYPLRLEVRAGRAIPLHLAKASRTAVDARHAEMASGVYRTAEPLCTAAAAYLAWVEEAERTGGAV